MEVKKPNVNYKIFALPTLIVVLVSGAFYIGRLTMEVQMLRGGGSGVLNGNEAAPPSPPDDTPALMLNAPPAPASPDPTAINASPADPDTAEPVLKLMEPLEPADADPVLNDICPPAVVPDPDDNNIDPPAAQIGRAHV